ICLFERNGNGLLRFAMPTYDYICTGCGHEFEFFQSMKDNPLKECPACETGEVRRKIGLGAGIIFKGSGFYETDFKDRKGTKPTEGSDTGSKTETKSEPKAASGDGGGTSTPSSSAPSSTSTASSE